MQAEISSDFKFCDLYPQNSQIQGREVVMATSLPWYKEVSPTQKKRYLRLG